MDFQEFERSLQQDRPPENLSLALAALWWDAKGDWNRAHQCAQEDDGPAGAWVHAYLHRKEGDLSNAGYWYGRAGKATAHGPLVRECEEIVRTLLGPD